MTQALAVALALSFQQGELGALLEKIEKAEQARRSFTAKVDVEVEEKFEETSVRAEGTVTLKVDEAGRKLAVVLREPRGKSRPVKTLIVDEEVVIHTGCPALATVRDLSKKEQYHPFDLWRRGFPKGVLEDFEVTLEREPEAVPMAVTGMDGKEIEPALAKCPFGRKPGVAKAAAGSVPPAYALTLVPKNVQLREAILSIRVYVNKETHRVDRMSIDTPLRLMNYALRDIEEPPCLDDSLFELEVMGEKK